jgi:hypothetical protein
MVRSQVQGAEEANVYARRDDGAAMALALRRLAALRATIHRDRPDDVTSFLPFANPDRAGRRPQTLGRSWDAPDFIFDSDRAFSIEAARPPLDLRGRLDCLAEMPPAPAPAQDEEAAHEMPFGVGAVAGCLTFDAPTIPAAHAEANCTQAAIEDEIPVDAVGAFADLASLIALTPLPAPVTTPSVIDLDIISEDDALAEAGEASYAAALDPAAEYVWGVPCFTDDNQTAAPLAAGEAALWNLPRAMPCAEVFALNPNHETAVKIIRALRIRTDMLGARAFTETTGFGALHTSEMAAAWFPITETPQGPASEMLDAGIAFAAWDSREVAPRVIVPDRPRPILSEEELDALLATPAAQDSHELDDDWQENPVWRETFWHGVDAYLQTVEDCTFRQEAIKVAPDAPVQTDIEIRGDDDTPAMHFWRPGDETDLAIDGEGLDLFLIGGDATGIVLIEDGAMHAMRTGRGTRVGEVVVSWSDDLWADVNGTEWTRVATLSGVSDLRVEQTAAHDRVVVVSGELSGTALKADRVCLVKQTEDGPLTFPVRHVGGFADGVMDDWPFAEAAGGSEDARLLI